MALAHRAQLVARHDPFPDLALHRPQHLLGRGAPDESPARDEPDASGGRLHVRNDVRGENHDALAREIPQEIAEPHPFFRIEPAGGLVHDQQARIVEQRLGDSDPLPHPARESAQWPPPDVGEVHEVEQLVDALARRARLQTAHGRQVLEELHGAEVGIDAEVLGQVAEHLT